MRNLKKSFVKKKFLVNLQSLRVKNVYVILGKQTLFWINYLKDQLVNPGT
jgi:hypothetical protein